MKEESYDELKQRLESLELAVAELNLREKALRESEELYRRLIELSFDGVGIYVDGKIVFVNDKGAAILGAKSPEQIVGRDVTDFVHPDSLKSMLRRFARVHDKNEYLIREEELLIRLDGKVIDVEVSGIPITWESKPAGLTVIREITERKSQECRTSDAFSDLQEIFNAIPDAVVYADTERRILRINPGFTKMFGYELAEVYGKNTAFMYQDDAMYREMGTNRYNPQAPVESGYYEVKYRRRDGSVFVSETLGTKIRNGYGDIIGYLAIIRDITEKRATEEKLRESEELHRITIESISDAVFITDDNGNFTYICPNAENIFGYSFDEIKSFGVIHRLLGEDIFNPGDLKALGELRNIEREITDKSGALRTVLVNVKTVSIRGGTIVYTCREITERKNAAKALLESRERLDLAMSAANIGLWDWAFGTEKIISNEQYYTMLGYEPFEFDLTYKAWKSSLHPDDYDRAVEILEKYIRGEADVYENEFRLRTKTGSWIWINSRGKIITWDDDGNPVRIMGIHADITERHHAEQKILDIARFPEENPNPVMRIGSDGQLLYNNRASLALLDVWQCRPGGTVPDDIARHVENALKTGVASKIDVEAGDKILSLVFAPVAGMSYVNIYGHDITSERRAEEARHKLEAQIQHTQKLESLGVLAGGIAHDFNNILVGILGNADLALLDMSHVSPARETVEEIKKAAIRASELTNQMLAYSGKGRFLIEPIFLNELIVEMGHMLKLTISKKASLKFDFDDNLPPIEADAAQIRQIVMNLITNASDALGDKNGIITITTSLMDIDKEYLETFVADDKLPEGLYVSIEVSDTGCGMDSETLSKIFDPFFTTKFTGRGLGMSAVLGIVRGHKGAIKIYSEPGKGTTFRVLFPASKQTEAPKENTSAERLKSPLGQGTVLVVDDEPSVRTVVKRMLEKSGFDVLTANDGREGLERFKEHADEICLVILDMTMPYMNGEEVFREIKKIRKDIRVILSSGFNEQDATNRFAGKGLAGFIQKPFQIGKLLEKIREVMNGGG